MCDIMVTTSTSYIQSMVQTHKILKVHNKLHIQIHHQREFLRLVQKRLSSDGCDPLRACPSMPYQHFPLNVIIGFQMGNWWYRFPWILTLIHTWTHAGNVPEHFRDRLHVWKGLKTMTTMTDFSSFCLMINYVHTSLESQEAASATSCQTICDLRSQFSQ